ncbi:C40 family peptidase [Umezawaea tangerina]|uniref:Cell wall-associated NlpC family hydrolase n=1 Tax=Umezawaea tangerina TaxID=84725 RepID=A0A2T0THI7_9PSEU|nr:C40 family peptidase [Umezawaea tangerina]PRY45130.1 cell wall-associated NlpC family hydrolase [Umezawaea tangerina]
MELIAVALAVALLTAAPTAPAEPEPPAGQSAESARYQELSRESARTNEDVLTTAQDLVDKRAVLDEATTAAGRSRRLADDALAAEILASSAADRARATADGLSDEVDHIVEISFKGLRLNGLAAIFSADSPEEFLDAAMIMDFYAERQGGLVAAAGTAADDALAARQVAVDARTSAEASSAKADEDRDTARRLTDDAVAAADLAQRRKADLDREIDDVRGALDRLATADRAALAGTGPAVDVPLVEGAAGDAVRFALAQVGKPYVWGAVGPDSYDCSGLVMTAFADAGVSIPRTTYAQALVGTPVPRGQVRAGDLVLYYDTVSHVAMAIDGTMAVQASTAGEPVKVSTIDGIGPIATIRRVAG